ncbi:MAG TPA: hypothetical protein VFG47_07050 [Geminicoccaceae bacterium]|nr:hypothetical protein [Geminicoccaceae bacterium]
MAAIGAGSSISSSSQRRQPGSHAWTGCSGRQGGRRQRMPRNATIR